MGHQYDENCDVYSQWHIRLDHSITGHGGEDLQMGLKCDHLSKYFGKNSTDYRTNAECQMMDIRNYCSRLARDAGTTFALS
jgi:hypothetical protein